MSVKGSPSPPSSSESRISGLVLPLPHYILMAFRGTTGTTYLEKFLKDCLSQRQLVAFTHILRVRWSL